MNHRNVQITSNWVVKEEKGNKEQMENSQQDGRSDSTIQIFILNLNWLNIPIKRDYQIAHKTKIQLYVVYKKLALCIKTHKYKVK